MTESIDGGGPLVKCVVARGRTVQTGGMKYEKIQAPGAPFPTFVPVPVEGKFIYGPGETIELSADEFRRMHAMGYVRRDDEPETRPANYQDGSLASVEQSGVIGSISYPQ